MLRLQRIVSAALVVLAGVACSEPAGALEVSPNSDGRAKSRSELILDFGSGYSSPTPSRRTIRLINTGDASLRLQSLEWREAVSGLVRRNAFSIDLPTGKVLAPGEPIEVTVTYRAPEALFDHSADAKAVAVIKAEGARANAREVRIVLKARVMPPPTWPPRGSIQKQSGSLGSGASLPSPISR